MAATYDTGALLAADRGERRVWARHRALLERGEVPTVPAPVLAQGWRGGAPQAMLSKLLAGCDSEALDDAQARAVGALAALAGASDIVDVTVVEGALRRRDVVISSDPDDLRSIASAARRRLVVEAP
ncbi:MAG: twitching motility protein PilT [Solirubrobacteraceae bacterium]